MKLQGYRPLEFAKKNIFFLKKCHFCDTKYYAEIETARFYVFQNTQNEKRQYRLGAESKNLVLRKTF